MKSCTVEDCTRKYYAKGLCEAHYARQRKYGRLTPLPKKELVHGTLTGYAYWKCRCEECLGAQREYYQRWHDANPTAYMRHNKTRQLRRDYGIELADYLLMHEQQDGKCAICGGPPENGKSLAVDHCHVTGRVRGLLCLKCNSGIGMFKDSLETVLAAVDYLLLHSEAIPDEVVA
jgi:hypothetical protein